MIRKLGEVIRSTVARLKGEHRITRQPPTKELHRRAGEQVLKMGTKRPVFFDVDPDGTLRERK